MSTDIVLIGPIRTGKSTLGKLIAGEFGLPQISLDKFRLQYYKDIGYDEELAREIRDKGGFLALLYYWNLYSAYSVEQILSDYKDCIFDFGAGIYESDEMFWRVESALALYPNVVLVLPSPDKEESLKILAERDRNPPQDLSF